MSEKRSVFAGAFNTTNVPQQFITEFTPYFEMNVHIYTNDVVYGDGTTMEAIAVANAVLTFKKSDLQDLYFKSRTSGLHGRVVAVATVPQPEVLRALGY